MLTTHLNSLPLTKLILIEDSVEAKSHQLLDFLLGNHQVKPDYRTHFLIFEGVCKRAKTRSGGCICHDFSSDSRNWVSPETSTLESITELDEPSVVIIDSLVHILYRFGLPETYKFLSALKNNKNVHQVVAVFHSDLLEEKEVVKYFRHLATLHLELDPHRVSYTFKKSPRKLIKGLEEYRFERGRFITQPIKKPNQEVIKQVMQQINPADISTFKIGLSEKDKESRSNLVLPYLPKEEKSGAIQYEFDSIDDWDEEDPDDDLDI